MISEARESREGSRYPALSVVSVVFKVLAYAVAIVGIIAAIAAPFVTVASFITELGIVVGILLAAAVQAIVYYAIGDLLQVAMDIEFNTFQTSNAMRQRMEMGPEERRAA